jgi:hypothetical protein
MRMSINFDGWTPSYKDIRAELEELLGRAKTEEERRDEAKEVVKEVWREKLPLLFGSNCPSAEPLFAPSENEEVFLCLHQFFEICLHGRVSQLGKEPYRGALVAKEPQAAAKAHSVAIHVLQKHGLLSKPTQDLLMLIVARANQYSMALETIAIMEEVLAAHMDKLLRHVILQTLDENQSALWNCYNLALACLKIKEGDESEIPHRNELMYPTLLNYFKGHQSVEKLFHNLKIKSEEKPQGWFSSWT